MTATLDVYRTEFTVRGIDDITKTRIERALEYEDPDAKWTDAYNKGHWDGRIRLYDEHNFMIPIGFLDRIREILLSEGYDVQIDDDADRSGDPVWFDWNEDYQLRPYQATAVSKLERGNGGVIGLPTGSGKTLTALAYIHEHSPSAGRPIVFVHTKELLEQWKNRAEHHLNADVGVIGNGNWTEGQITIASTGTLLSRGTSGLTHNYGIGVWDECHRTSAAEKIFDIGKEIDVDIRIGLSATPWRTVEGEELKIEGAVGSEAHSVEPESLIDEGYLAKPTFKVIRPGRVDSSLPSANLYDEYHEAYQECIVENKTRNQLITGYAIENAVEGRRVYVAVNRIEHGELLSDMIGELATFLQGSDDSEHRQQVLDDFSAGDVIVSTLLREGVDLPELDCVILAHAVKSDVMTIQTIGRSLRPSGSTDAVVMHVKDPDGWFYNAYAERSESMKEYYGKYF